MEDLEGKTSKAEMDFISELTNDINAATTKPISNSIEDINIKTPVEQKPIMEDLEGKTPEAEMNISSKGTNDINTTTSKSNAIEDINITPPKILDGKEPITPIVGVPQIEEIQFEIDSEKGSENESSSIPQRFAPIREYNTLEVLDNIRNATRERLNRNSQFWEYQENQLRNQLEDFTNQLYRKTMTMLKKHDIRLRQMYNHLEVMENEIDDEMAPKVQSIHKKGDADRIKIKRGFLKNHRLKWDNPSYIVQKKVVYHGICVSTIIKIILKSRLQMKCWLTFLER
ncbi:uncharacterized protein LOC110187476 [Drosophila serrata]|uniref:uncharacterized protein LOC110187476 n=1 Tax=Drosophila serrata TaxID=7274 RepID=UPI000A1D03E3|nr:uncharacterized protein LOC110187476 [Drosophila serrata]